MRTSQASTYRSLQAFLDRTSGRMAELQLQAATGKKLNRPSDDPTAIAPVLSANSQIRAADRYLESIETGIARLDGVEATLDGIENTLVRAKEIGIASVNGTLSPQDMQTYANEVAQLRDSLLDYGNIQREGKYIFAGFAEKTRPFVATDPAQPISSTNPIIFAGDIGSTKFEIAPNELIEVNVNGSGLLLGDADNDGFTDAGAIDIFAQLTTLEEALKANDQAAVQAAIDPLDTAADQVRKERSFKGNIGRRLEAALDHMEQIKIDMQAFRARFEDADLLETITNLQQQEQSFQAALSVTGRVSELSILNYI